MTFLDSILLGALEGLTEFLPVSSTGHLILASQLLGLVQTDAFKSFEIAIQLGSIAAVAVLYFKQFLHVRMLLKLAVAFVPTGIAGFLLYPLVKGFLIGNSLVVVVSLVIGGAVLLLVEHFHTEPQGASDDASSLTFRQAFLVGCAQVLAFVPGVSRSGATVAGGMLMGLSRSAILSFSFLLAVPTMLAATAYDIYKTPEALLGSNLSLLLVGFVTAFVVALVVIRYALRFVRAYSFVPFALYRIALGIVFWLLVLA